MGQVRREDCSSVGFSDSEIGHSHQWSVVIRPSTIVEKWRMMNDH